MDMMKNELSVLKEKELILDSSEQNCVRLMNLHKAKGLEGNIVIMRRLKIINSAVESTPTLWLKDRSMYL